ncbi:MAG: gliding motility-associated C-terminal domain-containing protein [Bacteroidetes bacterium]|nr:gliding motility-associated C-terminal domain-containing protein [Bacteroidota bacterium]
MRRVTNVTTQCFTDATATVISDPAQLQVLTVTKLDQAICNPDGKITVTTMNSGTPANYSFAWFRSDPTTAALVDGSAVQIAGSVLQPGAAAGQYPTMGASTYFVVATKNAGLTPGSGCSTAPFEVEIKDIHVDPIVAGTPNSDVNCAGGLGAGSIILSQPANPINFTYSWVSGDDINTGAAVLTSGVNGKDAVSLQEGDYTVRVKDNSTGCSTVESFTVANSPTIVAFDFAGFSAPAVTTCTLATGTPSNGSATVTDILENGAAQPLVNYAFTWTDATNTVLPNSPAPTLVGVSPGTYFVKATNTVSNCIANLSFNIDDMTKGTTTVTLTSFGQPEQCINAVTGFLTVQGGGTVAGPYSYEWFTGDQRPTPVGAPLAAPGPPLPAGSTLSNIPIASGQTFTVKVINSNNCWAVDAYSVPLIVNPIVLTASATPLTFCSSDNGEVYATIVNDSKFDYNYFWAKGASVNPPVDYTTNNVSNLPAGTYTVVAVDILDAGCVSPTVTVTVNNEQVIPVVSARVLKNLTVCDPTKPDGEASADVGGDVAHYTFDWYTGSAANGVSFYRGAEVGNLTSITYTVLGTETSTGCSATASVNVPFTPVIIPAPTVTVISNVTSCIADNGQLSATVDGVTKDYIFDWANGANPPPPIDFTGEIYKNLSVGQYTVIATSKITGCVSGPAKAPISNEQKFPEFRFLIQSATCSIQVGNNPPPTKGDGFITLLVSNDLSVEQVLWYQGGSVSNGKVVGGTLVEDGPNLQDAFAGVYQVNVRTTLGCENAKEVKLPVEILPYNGISRRDGSDNSYFLINCIDNFENNHVEIFNRAGTKVYEADGYNNSDIVFDGKSNRGISLLGTNLPAGTYFYVIDKRDGSKKMVGYLELVD